MTHQERDRLGISLVLALAIHAVIIVSVILTDWEIREYPESTPVFVELPDYETTPPVVTEDPPETEPPEPAEQISEPEPPEPIVEPEPTPRTQPAVEPETQTQPEPRQTETAPATELPQGRDAPPGSFDFSDDPMLRTSPDSDRDGQRTPEADLFSFDEVTDTGELPAWVAEGAVQPLAELAPSDRATLAQKTQTVPGFEERLDAILSQATSATPGTASPGVADPQTGESAETGALPGDSNLEWLGGDRRPRRTLTRPDLEADDFGGLVPARIVLVIVFDVNASGLVEPGSLILRQGSGYTRADQKVRLAVSRWQFEPAPGSPNVTAIGTLILEREDIR